MYHTFGDNLNANLEVFCCAERALRGTLDEYFASDMHDGGGHWINKTDMVVYGDENMRHIYLAWREARTGIDSVRERIAEKDEKDKAEKST